MQLARVIGTVVTTVKNDSLEGRKLLIVQTLNWKLEPSGKPMVAVDAVGAGIGELVFWCRGKEASFPFKREDTPTDCTIVGIVPNISEGRQIREALDDNLSAKNIAAEVAYLNQKSRASFERTYGWAWLLKLAEELHGWNDEDGRKWSRNLQPLADAFAERYLAFLPKQNYPIRTGVHPNTAFGLAFALDYARAVGNRKLETLITERSRTYFGRDVNYPGAWEPGGEDFFSAALMEADLMRRVMKGREFARVVSSLSAGHRAQSTETASATRDCHRPHRSEAGASRRLESQSRLVHAQHRNCFAAQRSVARCPRSFSDRPRASRPSARRQR